MKLKKGLASILEVSLLLIIVVVAGVYFQYWYNGYNSEKLSKVGVTGFKDNVQFINLIKLRDNLGVLYLKTEKGYEVIKGIKIGNHSCRILESNVIVTRSTPIKISCPIPFGVAPDIFIITNSDSYDKSIVVS